MTDEERKYGDSDFIRRTDGTTRARSLGARAKRVKSTRPSFAGLSENIRKGVIDKKIKKYNQEYFELRRLAEVYEGASKEKGSNYDYDEVVSSANRYNAQMERLAKLGARILVWDDDISKIRVKAGGRPIKVPGWAIGPLGSVWAWYTEKKLEPEIKKMSGEIEEVFKSIDGVPQPPVNNEPVNVDKVQLDSLHFDEMVPQVKPVLMEEKTNDEEKPINPTGEDEKKESEEEKTKEPEKAVEFSKRNLKDDFITNKLLSEGRYADAYSIIDENYLLTRRAVKDASGKKTVGTFLMHRVQNTGDYAKDYKIVSPKEFAEECGITDSEEAKKLYDEAIKMVSDSKTIVNVYKEVWDNKNIDGDALGADGRVILDGVVSEIVTGKRSRYAELYKEKGLHFTNKDADKVITVAVALKDNSPESRAFRKSILEFGVLEKTEEKTSEEDKKDDIEKKEEREDTASQEDIEVKSKEERRTEEERAKIAEGVKRGYSDIASEFFDKPKEEETVEEPETPVKESEEEPIEVPVQEEPVKTQVEPEKKPEVVDNGSSITKLAEELNHYITIRDNLQKVGVDSPEVKESLENVQKAISSLLTEINKVALASISRLGENTKDVPAVITPEKEIIDVSAQVVDEEPVEETIEEPLKMEGVGTEGVIPELTDFGQGGKTQSELASDRALGHADESVWEQILADPDLKVVTDEEDRVVGHYEINRDDEFAVNHAKATLEREQARQEKEQQAENDAERAHKDLVEYFTGLNSKDKFGNQRDEATVRSESEEFVKSMEAEGSDITPVVFIQTMKQNNPQAYESIQAAHRRRLERHKEETYSNYEHSEDSLDAKKSR